GRVTAGNRLARRLQLGARPLRPGRRLERVEDVERRSQLLARVDAPARAAKPLAEAELGSGPLEAGAVVQRERGAERVVELVVVREEGAVTRGGGLRPGPVGGRGEPLEPVELVPCGLEVARPDQRLDQV